MSGRQRSRKRRVVGYATKGQGRTEVDGKRYKGTEGLYNLLFLKDPKTFNKDDEQLYVQLLMATNALYKTHKSNSQIQGVRSDKYPQIIKPILKKRKQIKIVSEEKRKLLEAAEEVNALNRSKSWSEPYTQPTSYTSHTGGGFDQKLVVESKPHRYVYFNDFNEIIDRLLVLHASKRAGNTSHDNEIASIEEELREANIIH